MYCNLSLTWFLFSQPQFNTMRKRNFCIIATINMIHYRVRFDFLCSMPCTYINYVL